MGRTTNAADRDPLPDFRQVMGHRGPLWMLFMPQLLERCALYAIRWALVGSGAVLFLLAPFIQRLMHGVK